MDNNKIKKKYNKYKISNNINSNINNNKLMINNKLNNNKNK